MRTAIVLAALNSAVAFAQYHASSGQSSSGVLPGAVPQRAAAAAGRHPNATREVTFTRTLNSTSETWTWRLNVTEIDLPNDVQNYGKPNQDYSKGYQVVNVQWQLDWPKSKDGSQQSLQSYLAETEQQLYLGGLAYRFPMSVMANWTNPSNGDCTSLLGEKCIAAIQNGNLGSPECDATLNTGQQNARYDMGANAVIYAGISQIPTLPDDTISYSTSNSYQAGNDTVYDWVVSVVHIMILQFPDTSDSSSKYTSGPSILCQVVDYKSPSKPGSHMSGSTGTSAAPTLGQSAVTIGLVVALSMLLAVL